MIELLLFIIGLFFFCVFINMLPTPKPRYKHLVSNKRSASPESNELI